MSSYGRRTTTYRPSRNRSNTRRNVYQTVLNVEKSHIGYLIGPRGSVIKGLQQKYGIRSRIDQENRKYILSGDESKVKEAVQDINRHISWIYSVTKKTETPMSEQEQKEEAGWSRGNRSKNQPRRMVQKTTARPIQSTNAFASLDSDSDESDGEVEEDIRSGKYHGDVPSVGAVSKPTGSWANGVSSQVKADGEMKISRAMLEQRLAGAIAELEKAEKKLAYDKNTHTNCVWADIADTEDSENEVEYWKETVEELQQAILDW